MNLIKKLLLTTSLFAFAVTANAQNVKPKFKEITLVGYRPNDSTKNLAVTINIYYHINADGIIHIIMNEMNGLNYTGFVRDTTYKLADEVISALNKIFNGERKLSSYMVEAKPTKGTSLRVPAIFTSYVAVNGAADQMVLSQDFFCCDMNTALNRIIFARQAWVERNIGVYHDNALEARILKEHLSCKCIPAVEAPPTVKHLEIKN